MWQRQIVPLKRPCDYAKIFGTARTRKGRHAVSTVYHATTLTRKRRLNVSMQPTCALAPVKLLIQLLWRKAAAQEIPPPIQSFGTSHDFYLNPQWRSLALHRDLSREFRSRLDSPVHLLDVFFTLFQHERYLDSNQKNPKPFLDTNNIISHNNEPEWINQSCEAIVQAYSVDAAVEPCILQLRVSDKYLYLINTHTSYHNVGGKSRSASLASFEIGSSGSSVAFHVFYCGIPC